jgi:hypothetical protein
MAARLAGPIPWLHRVHEHDAADEIHSPSSIDVTTAQVEKNAPSHHH